MTSEMNGHFLQAVRSCEGIPEWVARVIDGHCEDGDVSVTIGPVSQSWLEFLDVQIQLNARGEEWTQVLRNRRIALTPYLGIGVATVCISCPGERGMTHVGMWYVDRSSRQILCWDAS